MKQENPRLRSRAKMRSLADLASGFVLSLRVRVGRNLRDKYNKKHSQAECEQPRKLPSRFWPMDHASFLGYPKLNFDATSVPKGQDSARPTSARCR
ncbi:MAG TPA: hypothetical protein VJN92_21970 [Candidatus Acidoferrum sp.]|nr:hypothetical protein [Candidatus Acidoferrum sp.]